MDSWICVGRADEKDFVRSVDKTERHLLTICTFKEQKEREE